MPGASLFTSLGAIQSEWMFDAILLLAMKNVEIKI